MIHKIQRMVESINQKRNTKTREKKITDYLKSGRIPWSPGYEEYKIDQIRKQLQTASENFTLSEGYGIGLDERIVEFPWVLSRLSNSGATLLDAGSTLNHEFVLSHAILKQKDIIICTYHPETPSFPEKRIGYVYQDLRELPFRNEWFDEITCISTLEHIDMDNTMYGYDRPNNSNLTLKSYEYLKAVAEMSRVLKPGGKILITVPYGKYESHGFFQQFDEEMIEKIRTILNGTITSLYFKYNRLGWALSDDESCREEESFNPHTGRGKKNDGAAHSRAICCLEFIKSNA
jgi:SAM-dependent methyltransferase